MTITNKAIISHRFLAEMYSDGYFPDPLVKKGEAILRELCLQIERQTPDGLEALYALTRKATEKFNQLSEEFDDQGSEIETVARECIGEDFVFIAQAYGFEQADAEELIAARDW